MAVSNSQILAFFKAHPRPKDSQVHAFAARHGMDADDVEEKIYALMGKYVAKEPKRKSSRR